MKKRNVLILTDAELQLLRDIMTSVDNTTDSDGESPSRIARFGKVRNLLAKPLKASFLISLHPSEAEALCFAGNSLIPPAPWKTLRNARLKVLRNLIS